MDKDLVFVQLELLNVIERKSKEIKTTGEKNFQIIMYLLDVQYTTTHSDISSL